MTIPKLIKNGKVAVIVSRGFGIGFSTSMCEKLNQEKSLFDPTLVSLIEQGADSKKLLTAAQLIYGEDESIGDVDSLAVVWVPEGTKFLIAEYDGAEFLIFEDDLKFTA